MTSSIVAGACFVLWPAAARDWSTLLVFGVVAAVGAAPEGLSRDRAARRLARLGEVIEDGVLLVDAAGELEFASGRARALLHVDDESWPALRARLEEALEHGRRGQENVTLDLDMPAPVRLDLRSLGEDGYVVVVRDRREDDAVEADLRHAAQTASLGRIYMGVAHDLRAPINATLLNLELLRRAIEQDEDVAEPDAARRRQWIRVIEEEMGRLNRSLDTVLVQTAPVATEPDRFDARDVVRHVQQLLAAQARQRRVTIDVSVPETPAAVFGRRDLVRQAVIHVAVNALEAAGERGRIAFALTADDGVVRLVISDTGTGVDESVKDRLFEKHVTTKDAGTGIGLYVARSIIEAEGGFIRLAQTGPAGTSFEIGWPEAPRPEERTGVPDNSTGRG